MEALYTPLAENLLGIRYVLVEDQKHSTLFPEGTTQEQLIKLVQEATKIAWNDNRSLRVTSKGYVIECCVHTDKGGIAYSTIYPLFFYAKFSPEMIYELTPSYSINSNEVWQAALSPEAIISYRIYDHEEQLQRVFVDIAPIFKDRIGVDKGIVLQFNREVAPELFELYEQSHSESSYQSLSN